MGKDNQENQRRQSETHTSHERKPTFKVKQEVAKRQNSKTRRHNLHMIKDYRNEQRGKH